MKKKKEAIEHYDRMIEWVKGKDASAPPHTFDMLEGSKEAWTGEFCSYCNHYSSYETTACGGCELRTHKGCCNGLWLELTTATTWHDWITAAEKVKKYIEENG